MHRSVGVAIGVDDTGGVEPVGLGEGEAGGAGSSAHWLLVDAATAACDPARAAAVAPVHTMAAPASTANTEDPARLPRVRTPGRDRSWRVDSRFSIIG